MSEVIDQPSEPQRTSPRGLVPGTLGQVKQAIIPMIAALFGVQSADFGFLIALGVALLVLVLMTGAGVLVWWRTTYTTGPEDIRVESGILSREARSVPYERIQDVSLEQNLLARILEVVKLRFETGAGGKDDLTLAYVTEAEGERLRQLVRERREGAAAEGADGVPAEQNESEGRLLFAMSPMRVALNGLFGFSLVLFGVLAAAAGQLDFLLPFDIWEGDVWRDQLSGPLGWILGVGVQAQIVGAILGVLSVVLVGLITGVVQSFLREFDFKLTRTDRGFRRRRGLLTKTDVVMPVHRVQAAIVSTGIIRRIWGWRGLKFVSLAQDAGSANHDVAPFAKMEEIAPIVSEASLALPPEDTTWHRPVAWRWLVGALWWSAVAIYAGIMLAIWVRPAYGIALVMMVLPIVAIRQYFSWRQYRHASDAQQLYFKRGVLKRLLMLAPRQRVQSVEIAQGPLGLLAGYVDLIFGLPGGRLRFTGVPREAARAIRAEVVETIAATDYSRTQIPLKASPAA